MLKVKLIQLVNSIDTIKKLINAEFPVKITFRFMSLTKQIDYKLKIFEEVRIELIKKYGEEFDGGFKVKDENIQIFNGEYSSLLNETVELDFEKLVLSDFPDNLKISANELVNIEWLIHS